MENFLNLILIVIQSPYTLFLTIAMSTMVKFYFLYLLIQTYLKTNVTKKTLLFLMCTLTGSVITDLAWMVKIWHLLFNPFGSYFYVSFFIRIAWGFLIIQYQSLSLFLDSLIRKDKPLHWLQKILLYISSTFACYFFYIALYNETLNNKTEEIITHLSFYQLPYEFMVMRFVVFYLLYLIILPALILTFMRIRSMDLPKLLKKQIHIFVVYLILPYLSSEILQCIYFIFPVIRSILFPIVSASTILLTYAIYYCIKKVLHLRFLNIETKVTAQPRATFVKDFRSTLELLGHATQLHELCHVTQLFFKNSFNIPASKTNLYIRPSTFENFSTTSEESRIIHTIESQINHYKVSLCTYIKKHKILVYDDLIFSSYYQTHPANSAAISFLNNINADLFLPIYLKEKKIAYIIIDRHEQTHRFYTSTDQDEMLLFANYLGNLINLFQHRTMEHLIEREKSLQEELSLKNRELTQYRESIRSFLQRETTSSLIGIICYKNRRFIYGNHAAKQLIKINLNQKPSHPITQAFNTIVHYIETYQSPHSISLKNNLNEDIIISGVLHPEKNMIVLTISYPNISDIISQHIDQLNNPTKRDYLLYLETTQSGKLINKLIPGSGEHLTNFKVDLLGAALSEKAILIDNAPQADLIAMVEIIHHISLRSSLITLQLTQEEKHYTWAIKLFGISSLLEQKQQEPPLLQTLDEIGTLFIRDIHFLSLETQNHLAEFLQYGQFRSFKSNQKTQANVRIICSSSEDLVKRTEQGLFCNKLLNMIQRTTLKMPLPCELSKTELSGLVDGFTDQTINSGPTKNIVTLNSTDKNKLTRTPPISLQELKKKVQRLIAIKSKTQHYQLKRNNETI